uniref:ALK and LTK ligand 2-like isoform X1 n=1 Tax=Solea senegalensis TaxID=28829 RepID=UPI001CD87140|nr:ALK and LTK ligand 2-like isoform X1 [Solea senegalensis]
MLRLLLLVALLVLTLAAGRGATAALLRGLGATELSARTEAGGLNRAKTGVERMSRSHHGTEAQAKDPRYKDKIIRQLTGPLSFNPKCRKQFNRLYHNTRDCTVPAYYRRCARLLMQLANSPRCTER